MFTQCDVIKNRVGRYLHKVASPKFGSTLFDTTSQRRRMVQIFYNSVDFIAKTEEFVVFN